MNDQVSAFPAGIKVYYGRRRFLMLTPSYVMDRAEAPYRRLAATLLLASGQPFQLEVDGQPALRTQAALIAPNVLRRRTLATHSNLALFDIPVGTPEYAALEPMLRSESVLPLDIGRFAHLLPMLKRAASEYLPASDVDQLFQMAVEAICGHAPAPLELDARIRQALQLIDQLPFDQATLARLSQCLGMSPSRLRHLFKEQTGCTITHYSRWAAVWRAASLWQQGKTLTGIAHDVGFYDLAHLDRAFNEVFGWNPSTVIDPAFIALTHCP